MNNFSNNNPPPPSYLGLFSTFLGVLNYEENLKQTSNDQLKELLDNYSKEIITDIQTTQKIILENQSNIIKKLEEMEGKK